MTHTHIILAGDSNALGYLNNAPASAPPYVNTARVQIWTPDSPSWQYMYPGYNTGTPSNPTCWGPEVQFANDWLADHPDPNDVLWIMKCAKGSTTLANDWMPGQPWYIRAKQAADAAWVNLTGTPYTFSIWDAILLVLGENDAVNPAYAQAYQDNLRVFCPSARHDWDARYMIMSRIEDTMGAAADNLAVRTAQWYQPTVDPLTRSFKTIGFPQQPDLVHYNAPGHIMLGNSFYAANPK